MSKKNIILILSVSGSLLALYIGWVGMVRWGDSTPPQVFLKQPFDLVGPSTPLVLHVEDSETGLREVSVRIVQNLESFSLAQEEFPSHGWFSPHGGPHRAFDLLITPFADDSLPRWKGRASLVVTARDYSWRGIWEGNWQRFTHKFTGKFTPPRVAVLFSLNSIDQGGSGLIQYQVSGDATSSGIQVATTFFPGYPAPRGDRMFSLVAIPHNLSPDEPISLVAHDGLGNTVIQPLDLRIKRKKWRTRRIQVSDRFIERTVLPIISQTPDLQDQDGNLENFLEVNGKLRQINTQQLVKLASKSKPEFLWNKAFRQLSNSQVEAKFADHRNYFYQGKHVDTQDHLGIDLAATKRYPIEAANSGVVIWAANLGIYGNTMVIDHGYGLQSLYAHLSSYDVKAGDFVKTGQVIARSGKTGLAGGDHLHFSLLLQGVHVNPLEWWDPFWVKTRITDPLDLSGDSGIPTESNDMNDMMGPAPISLTPG